jgi:hypothetical protein
MKTMTPQFKGIPFHSHRRAGTVLAFAFALGSTGCGATNGSESSGEPVGAHFPTTSIVFGEDGSISTYLSLLHTLDPQAVDDDTTREFAGWADLWVHGGQVFMTDGEAPALTRYAVAAGGALEQDDRLSFANYGTDTAAFWRNVIVSPTKAYLFVTEAREIVVWNPATLEIGGTFALPDLDDRGAQQPYVTNDRGAIVRGDRLYVTVGWGDWDNYSLSNDSVILVVDTTSDEIIQTLPVACPDLNVATLDDKGDIYFSNWVYGVGPSLFDGGAHTCAVRIKAGTDTLDADWALTFSDATDGREAAALRFLGNGRALISVLHHERFEITPDVDRFGVVDAPNWRFWILDLDTRQAELLESIDWHGGGYYSTRIDDLNMLFVPSGDYSSTAALAVFPDGRVEPRWEATGWVTRLFKLR